MLTGGVQQKNVCAISVAHTSMQTVMNRQMHHVEYLAQVGQPWQSVNNMALRIVRQPVTQRGHVSSVVWRCPADVCRNLSSSVRPRLFLLYKASRWVRYS